MSPCTKTIVSIRNAPAAALLCALLSGGLSGCGGSGLSGGFETGTGATTTPFAGPLEAMTKPITFNSIASNIENCSNPLDCDPSSSIATRSRQNQITIDPNADTVDISSGSFDLSFAGVDFTGGTTGTTVIGDFSETQGATTERLTILLPNAGTNPFNWASYGIWSTLTIESPSGDELFDGGALSFGVLTPLSSMPKTGTANYTIGFMNGLYVDGSRDNFSLSGAANMTVNFNTRAITGQFSSINAVPLGAPGPVTAFGAIDFSATLSANNFSGNATSSGTGQSLNGPLQGSFYGPTAQEAGGTYFITGGDEHAVGGFAVRKP